MKKIFLVSLFLMACAEIKDPSDIRATAAEVPAADEVKLIHPSVTAPLEPGTFQSAEYEISNESRLLIRLGKLKTVITEVLDEQAILVRVAPSDGDLTVGRQSLRLCPLTTNWMMYATWSKAHSYRHGAWKKSGADFDEAGCLSALPTNSPILQEMAESFFCETARVLCFDVKGHVKNYVRARGINYGWVLLTLDNQVVHVQGDTTPLAPALFYRRLR